MFKFIALIFTLLGVFIGVQYSDEIKSTVDEDRIEHLKESAETLIDNIEELKN